MSVDEREERCKKAWNETRLPLDPYWHEIAPDVKARIKLFADEIFAAGHAEGHGNASQEFSELEGA